MASDRLRGSHQSQKHHESDRALYKSDPTKRSTSTACPTVLIGGLVCRPRRLARPQTKTAPARAPSRCSRNRCRRAPPPSWTCGGAATTWRAIASSLRPLLILSLPLRDEENRESARLDAWLRARTRVARARSTKVRQAAVRKTEG